MRYIYQTRPTRDYEWATCTREEAIENARCGGWSQVGLSKQGPWREWTGEQTEIHAQLHAH